jgi:hypothetical protein
LRSITGAAVGGGEVADPAQQAAGDPRRAAGAGGDLGRAVVVQRQAHLAGRAAQHLPQLLGV